MTRDDMMVLVEHSIRGSSTKAPLEDTNIKANRSEVEDFLNLAADWVAIGINTGFFDE